MTGLQLFWPIVAQAVLVFLLYSVAYLRRADSAGREAVAAVIAAQFRLPMLLALACILLYIVDADNPPTLVMAGLFNLSCYAEAWLLLTRDRPRLRHGLSAIGLVGLAGLWIWLAVWMALA